MKKTLIATLLASISISASAAGISDTAQVVSSTPMYQTYTTQECHTVTTAAPAERSMGGSILGGVAGALLGSQVGQGNGKVAAGALGAITGAIAGDRIQNSGSTQQVCNPVSRQVITGYQVTYQYNGHTGTAVMQQQPGATINVAVVPQ